jgi:hypothetical protein
VKRIWNVRFIYFCSFARTIFRCYNCSASYALNACSAVKRTELHWSLRAEVSRALVWIYRHWGYSNAVGCKGYCPRVNTQLQWNNKVKVKLSLCLTYATKAYGGVDV